MKNYGYIHYWWFDSGFGNWIDCRHSESPRSAKHMQQYHRKNGWLVSPMKVVRVRMPELPKKMRK